MSGAAGEQAAPVRWMFPGTATAPVSAAIAQEFLARRAATDRQLLALVYGYGLDLGRAAWTLELDAALAHWRLRTTLTDSGAPAPSGPEDLERGVAALLRGTGGPSAEARRIAAELPEAARQRLQTALAGTRVAAVGESARPGLGVGSLVLVVLSIAAFLLYGVIRDRNPLRHGKDLVRRGDFATARLVFEELGALPEAHVWTAFAWLAEGDFPHALQALQAPGAARHLGALRPMDEPLETLETDPESPALLPRGLIAAPNPTLVYRSGPAGELVLLGRPFDDTATARPVRIRVADSNAGPPVVALAWPADLGTLGPGDYTWTTPGNELHPATFTLLPDEQRLELEGHIRTWLTDEMAYPVKLFLRAHYCLRNRLYMQAGQCFANLAQSFPAQPYPREMVDQVAAALGVDPSAFLR